MSNQPNIYQQTPGNPGNVKESSSVPTLSQRAYNGTGLTGFRASAYVRVTQLVTNKSDI